MPQRLIKAQKRGQSLVNDNNWTEFKKLIDQVDKAYDEMA
ncbi:unnamed protein product [marine sediment metagenome]|uniref:Uncharacterized protein n=1 Tax=marine sediment metagenome TaxID=412755 RepID=X1JF35_9ZZZZ